MIPWWKPVVPANHDGSVIASREFRDYLINQRIANHAVQMNDERLGRLTPPRQFNDLTH